MDWLWLRVRLSLRLAWHDMRKFRDHVVIGIAAAVVSVGISVAISFFATNEAAALFGGLVWLATPVVIYLCLFVRRLIGWDGLYEHEWDLNTLPDSRPQLTVGLKRKGAPLLAEVPPEISCVLRPLGGREIGPVITRYPGHPSAQFEDGTVLVAGAYAVIWRERMPPTTGKQRVIAYYRRTVPPESSEQSAAVAQTDVEPPA